MEYKFSKEELIDLLEMACSLQKGNDYQKAGNILFDEDIALKSNELLDYLSNTDNNIVSDDIYYVDEIIELTKKWK